MTGKTIGFALCGSFCTFKSAVEQVRKLVGAGNTVIPIMSEAAFRTNTRFGKAKDFAAEIEAVCDRKTKTLVIKNLWLEDAADVAGRSSGGGGKRAAEVAGCAAFGCGADLGCASSGGAALVGGKRRCGATLRTALDGCLKRFAKFNGCDTIVWASTCLM